MEVAMAVLRSLYSAMLLLSIFLTATFAATPESPILAVATFKQKVVDANAKVDKFSISCLCYERIVGPDDPQLCLGSVEYRFDRATKQFAIGAGGLPVLYAKNNRLFVLAFREQPFPSEHDGSTFLQVSKPAPIRY